jgi:uracil-DNA glycosylase family 4
MFDPDCRACERLADHLQVVRDDYPDYFAAPVPPFGDPQARLLVVGLAPGMHGANRSGRPFTGDHAGILLYRTLYECGFASAPESLSRDDGLRLNDCRITNAVKCLPPANKPLGSEVRACNAFLAEELRSLPADAVVFALGGVAHGAVLRALGLKLKDHPFGHGNEYPLERGATLLDSYHCSRYNTKTRRLTTEMFQQVVGRARALLEQTG